MDRTHRIRAVTVTLLATVAACSVTTPALADTPGSSAAQIITHLNGERHFASIPPVSEDARLSAGCAAHNRYLALNGQGSNPHRELPGHPGYTPAGARAAAHSVLGAVGIYRPGQSAWTRSDPFDAAPYHLLELMTPGAATMGADELITSSGQALQCVDVLGGRTRPAPRRLQVYEFPGRGPVPSFYPFFEGPFAGHSGVWLFVYFRAPRNAHVTLRSMKLVDPSGRSVAPLATFVTGGLRTPHSALAVRRASVSSGFFDREPAAGFLPPVVRPGRYGFRITASTQPRDEDYLFNSFFY